MRSKTTPLFKIDGRIAYVFIFLMSLGFVHAQDCTALTADGVQDTNIPSHQWKVELYQGYFGVQNAPVAPYMENQDHSSDGVNVGTPILAEEAYTTLAALPLSFTDSNILTAENPFDSAFFDSRANIIPGGLDTSAANGGWQMILQRTATASATLTIGQAGSYFDDHAELFVDGVLIDDIIGFTPSLAAADVITYTVSPGENIEIRLTNIGGVGGFSLYINSPSLDFDNNSIPDACQTDDFDSDGYPDGADLDDDNDGILDTDECGTNTSTANMTGDIVDSDTGAYPLVISGNGISGGPTNDTAFLTNVSISTTLGVGDIYEGCEFILVSDDFDDGFQASIDGTPVLYFDQSNWDNTLGASTTAFNDGGLFDSDGSGLWTPWFGEGNPQLVIKSNGEVMLMVDTTDPGLRINALPYMDSTGPNWVLNTSFSFDCLTGANIILGNTTFPGGAGQITNTIVTARIFVCSDADGDGIPNSRDTDADGDGCPDAVEAAGTFSIDDVDGNGMLTGTVDSNGIPNQASGGQATAAAVLDANDSSACPLGPDRDNDGVDDLSDIDNDNDGILDTVEFGNCTTGIAYTIISDDFGTGGRVTNPFTNYCYEDGTGTAACSDFPGITTVNDGEYAVVQHPNPDASGFSSWSTQGDHTGNTDGRMMVVNASIEADEFYRRTIAVGPNNPVNIDLWILNVVNPGNNVILPDVSISIEDLGGTQIGTPITTGGIPENGTWNNFTASFNPGANSQIQLVLTNNSAGGGGNDLALDDITVTQIVCDSDGDLIPDFLDLDSDNDGIPDVIEAGGTDADGDGIIDGFTDSDNDGLSDNVDPVGPAIPGTPLLDEDTDNDGVKDRLDLDSDNDGITDVIEAGGPDADGNGRIDGYVDADNDGFSDTIDTDDSLTPAVLDGTGTPLPRPNFDNDTRPDYLDIDSDDDGITDATESTNQGAEDANGDGEIDNFTDTNGDGYNDATAANPITLNNQDGTGGPDYIDIDNDDDGIVDNIEGQSTANYIPPLNSDADNDGLDDAYDTATGETGINPVNTSGDGGPDYLVLDTDNDGITDDIEGWDIEADGIPETVASGSDADGDGLDDAYDTDDILPDPTNGQTPTSFPDAQVPGGDRDWREPADSDGDGVLDTQEALDGTDPNNPCDFVIASITETQGGDYLVADCDGDGVTNEQEIADNTNPEDPCDFIAASATVTPSGDYLISDCDGDGVTNGTELSDNTDPGDPCDFNQSSITLDQTGDWAIADCDGDTIPNGQEITDGTDPNDPCSSRGGIPPAESRCDIEIENELVGPQVDAGFFRIGNIEAFPNNTVRIYNRWGILVYETTGYDSCSNNFRGFSEGRATIQEDKALPVGVYFYIIDYVNDGEAKKRSGYLYVNR